MYRMIRYSEWIWSAFGDRPDLGVTKFANALGARASATAEDTSAAHRNRCVRGRRLASEASDRKARHSRLGSGAQVSRRAPHILAPLARTEGHSSDCLGPRRDGRRAARDAAA